MADILSSLMFLAGAMVVVAVIIGIGLYLYVAFAVRAMAKKTKTKNAWLAFIPVANVYLVTQIGKQSGWLTLSILFPFIPWVGSLALLAVMVFLWWKVAEALHRPGWWGILILIPVVNLVFMGIMAWGKK